MTMCMPNFIVSNDAYNIMVVPFAMQHAGDGWMDGWMDKMNLVPSRSSALLYARIVYYYIIPSVLVILFQMDYCKGV
jgi:hypothetical protein